jgi:hypothetical protein
LAQLGIVLAKRQHDRLAGLISVGHRPLLSASASGEHNAAPTRIQRIEAGSAFGRQLAESRAAATVEPGLCLNPHRAKLRRASQRGGRNRLTQTQERHCQEAIRAIA